MHAGAKVRDALGRNFLRPAESTYHDSPLHPRCPKLGELCSTNVSVQGVTHDSAALSNAMALAPSTTTAMVGHWPDASIL